MRAIAALDAGRSVLVAAPTGSGKTVVAEHAVAKALAEGHKAFYTTPIKALSNQKYADLVRRHGAERVGLLTGDNAINGDAPVVVMTTEVLRNMIYAGSPALRGLRYVVLDEVHFLQDAYRGPVWEEVIIHLPPDVRLVCLSATVSNAEELAEWISTVRGPTEAVIEERRPVELPEPLLRRRQEHARTSTCCPTLVDGRPNPEAEPARRRSAPRAGRRRRAAGRAAGSSRRGGSRWSSGCRTRRCSRPSPSSSAARPATRRATPASTPGCASPRPTSASRIRAIVDERTATLADADLDVLGFDRLLAGLEVGIAAHHAGMVPPFKEAVEACFAEGLVKAVFATETLALGINMPARSVVIERLTKFTGERHELPHAGRVHAAHRAGRAPRHRRGRLRHRALVAVRALRAGGGAGLEPHVRAALRVPAHLQHGRQPRAPLRARARPTTCSTSPSPSTRPTGRWCGSRPASSASRRASARLRGRGAAASAATSTSTGGCGPRRSDAAPRARATAARGASTARYAALEPAHARATSW